MQQKRRKRSDENETASFLQIIEDSNSDKGYWSNRNRFFHESEKSYLAFLIPSKLKVLELGCGPGDVLDSLSPAVAVGVDRSQSALVAAEKKFPRYEFLKLDIEEDQSWSVIEQYGCFDIVFLDNTLGYVKDAQRLLEHLARVCSSGTRIISVYHSALWEPAISVAEALHLKMPTPKLNSLHSREIQKFFYLAGLEVVKTEQRMLVPYRFFGLGSFANRFIATLPLINRLCLRQYVVGKLGTVFSRPQRTSVSIVIPCKNERGNIRPLVSDIPSFPGGRQLIFVEGGSSDGTWEEIGAAIKDFADQSIIRIRQPGKGKGDAVRAGFDVATGDILMILDADGTVRPDELTKFHDALALGRAEFVNGTRLIYGLERGAMRFLNKIANHVFARLFSYLLNQEVTDTLCGTKAISRRHYHQIKRDRSYFGMLDPFGDFDLIFGAAKLNLKFVEIPVRYQARTYGTTQISRFRHGLLLLRMVLIAYRKLKIV